ncbi:MAG: methyltransferase type 12, partial [Betaproteobacteria bacterium]|nr:methyltransferase type 12 [Betaproteobacteria bacterium]
ILAIDMTAGSTVDWHTQYIVFPLTTPFQVCKGDQISIRFSYQGGAPLKALSDSLEVHHVNQRVSISQFVLDMMNLSLQFQLDTADEMSIL